MQKIGTNISRYLESLRTPIIFSAASAILGAFLWEAVSQAVQSSLNHQIVGFYLMVVIALFCLILVTSSLMRIEKLIRKSNNTQFITSKPARLNKMTEYIKEAKESIYILSDLSGTGETKMEEHKKYIAALNEAIDGKKVKVKRIVVPTYASGKDAVADPDWIYRAPIREVYLNHFKKLHTSDDLALCHTDSARNVSMMIIDNKYLFWKPELTYGDKELDKLLDGGLFLEDYNQEVIADFIETFQKMHRKATLTYPDQFDSIKPKIE